MTYLTKLKGHWFKNALAVWLIMFGVCVMRQPQVGTSEFVFATVGNPLPIQILGALMVIFATVGLFTSYTPARLFLIVTPFGVYAAMALVSIVKTTVQDPGVLVILSGIFILPLCHVLDELRRR